MIGDVVEARSRRLLGLQRGNSIGRTVFLLKRQSCRGVLPNVDLPDQKCRRLGCRRCWSRQDSAHGRILLVVYYGSAAFWLTTTTADEVSLPGRMFCLSVCVTNRQNYRRAIFIIARQWYSDHAYRFWAKFGHSSWDKNAAKWRVTPPSELWRGLLWLCWHQSLNQILRVLWIWVLKQIRPDSTTAGRWLMNASRFVTASPLSPSILSYSCPPPLCPLPLVASYYFAAYRLSDIDPGGWEQRSLANEAVLTRLGTDLTPLDSALGITFPVARATTKTCVALLNCNDN